MTSPRTELPLGDANASRVVQGLIQGDYKLITGDFESFLVLGIHRLIVATRRPAVRRLDGPAVPKHVLDLRLGHGHTALHHRHEASLPVQRSRRSHWLRTKKKKKKKEKERKRKERKKKNRKKE